MHLCSSKLLYDRFVNASTIEAENLARVHDEREAARAATREAATSAAAADREF